MGGVKLCPRSRALQPPMASRYLVIHGDEFDGVIRYAKFLALLGDWAYDAR